MRVKQPIGKKGSLRWIQYFVNEKRPLLDALVLDRFKFKDKSIEWKSPLREDDYAEYRDRDFLSILALQEFQKNLKDFWPARGPQWDALAKTGGGKYLLFEAKANIPEVLSTCQAKDAGSVRLIDQAIRQTQEFLGVSGGDCWLNGFYQYANRICHLYFLREVCKVDAHLVLVYFCNDSLYQPTSKSEWKGAILLQKSLMGLKKHKLQQFIHEMFIDVSDM